MKAQTWAAVAVLAALLAYIVWGRRKIGRREVEQNRRDAVSREIMDTRRDVGIEVWK